jgi:hypothetical protein
LVRGVGVVVCGGSEDDPPLHYQLRCGPFGSAITGYFVAFAAGATGRLET